MFVTVCITLKIFRLLCGMVTLFCVVKYLFWFVPHQRETKALAEHFEIFDDGTNHKVQN